jgi:hypothetical protein
MRLNNLPPHLMVSLSPVLSTIWLAYGFGDAAKEGFSHKSLPLTQCVRVKLGFWCIQEAEKSSNNREFRNLRNFVKEEVRSGRCVGREVWTGTDNKVVT